MKTKTALPALCLAAAMLLSTACSSEPKSTKEVELASKASIEQWCASMYGPARVLTFFDDAEISTRTFTMTDQEKSFAYTAKSFAVEPAPDNSGESYGEQKESDFDKQYKGFFESTISKDLAELEETYEVKVSLDAEGAFGSISSDDEETAQSVAASLIEMEKAFDGRDRWGDVSFAIIVDDELKGHVTESAGYVPVEPPAPLAEEEGEEEAVSEDD